MLPADWLSDQLSSWPDVWLAVFKTLLLSHLLAKYFVTEISLSTDKTQPTDHLHRTVQWINHIIMKWINHIIIIIWMYLVHLRSGQAYNKQWTWCIVISTGMGRLNDRKCSVPGLKLCN